MIMLVRLIDLVVLFFRILGGRTEAGAPIRVLAWIALASIVALGLALFGYVVAHLLDVISAITGVTYD
ncbi:hypothetical protein ACFYVR_24420 [Rhodococcus sp. NPDC003318]|uniref:hypothetical protein n=1 Tax=Rhodococcus sp. NPDC003318 TaxID=3364503 RepID=UPI0036866601